MKHLKLFEDFSRKTPRYRKPEFELKELYRTLKKLYKGGMKGVLPKNIDPGIFDIYDPEGFEGEPKWLELHLDPPSGKDEKIGTEDLKEYIIENDLDERFLPFIDYCQSLFESGRPEKITVDFVRRNSDKFKKSGFDEVLKDPKFPAEAKREYEKAKEAGIQDLHQKGLQDKFPDINIGLAQWWNGYAADSFGFFDSSLAAGKEIPMTQFLKVGDDYYTIGGRRRMNWHILNGMDPTVWVVDLPNL